MPTIAVTAANTVALAASSVSRWGTAEMLERIMPEAYSLVMTSTPSTPIASWAMKTPLRLSEIGSNSACSFALISGYWLTTTADRRIEMPMMPTAVISRVHYVERTVRSLVHSERRTPETMDPRGLGGSSASRYSRQAFDHGLSGCRNEERCP